jgi:hypothetical protein
VQDKTLQQVAELANIMSIDQLNIKIRRSLKGHNAKVNARGHTYLSGKLRGWTRDFFNLYF